MYVLVTAFMPRGLLQLSPLQLQKELAVHEGCCPIGPRLWALRPPFECRPYCFYDSGSFVRRRGVTCAQKDRGGSADHDQIEDYAHAQRHAWEMLLW